MLSPIILVPAILNGLLTGAVYALVALGLTLIYGVLHIINFAHGALLTAAMFAAFFAHRMLGLDPYLAAVGLTPLFFCLGYALQRFVIGPAAHGEDRNILLITLGLAVVIENALLYAFREEATLFYILVAAVYWGYGTQLSVFASPSCVIIDATSDRLYGCEPERTQILPLSFGSASDS